MHSTHMFAKNGVVSTCSMYLYCVQDRIGGRVHTFRSGPYVADLGAMVITGLGGTPLSILKRHMELKMSKIKRRCPLYFTTGMSTVLPYSRKLSICGEAT